MSIRSRIFTYACFAVLTIFVGVSADAQTRKRAGTAKKAEAPAVIAHDVPSVAPLKRNGRPTAEPSPTGRDAVLSAAKQSRSAVPAYRYEFSQPDFVISSIRIEHDESGAGTITFKKKGDDELITDPITVSPKSIARINDALTALNFLDSRDSYQHEKDFSHLGNIKFARTAGGRSREVTFNYTTNKDAKVLMDEYRKIGNQYIWIFDIKLSRENQPLDAPRLFDSLDSMIKRNEISDAHQMEPFLRQLADDESIPLIARNHAARLVKQFEKEKAKEQKKSDGGN